ncbi:Calcium uptake protein 3, mitochondrial [Trichinella pseudospiralis]|uniref:Calcium uptake protein 3, mitochondrial n=2 Tax=Trichinella pseudospiralis TaxID=6337 RepID=A0A0V1K7U6_TRIPS|nr:Calcium uptake protein 3, mitochondrial [Trichinella pseudospiralis]KRZ43281.1 Calcium uptake protein 3, mitochondrial [Trichinella pseudospiralis]
MIKRCLKYAGSWTFCYFVYCQFGDCKPFGIVRSHFINCSTIEEANLSSWKRFFEFASFNCGGEAYMSPFDFMQSLTSKASPEIITRKTLNRLEALQLTKETPSVTSSSCTFFRDANHHGLISYFDYLFLLSLLSEPESRFRIAFDLFDQNKDGKLEMDEFYRMTSGILPKKLRENHYEKTTTKHKISEYTKDDCFIFTTLSNHFFGSDHKSTLSYDDFHRFIRNFQLEVWEFQFMLFSTSEKDLTELEFAKMIYSYISLPLHHQEQCFKHLEAKSHSNLLNRISFEEVCKFFTLLNNLNNFSYALNLCNLSNDPLTHAEFQRAVNASCGFKFQPNVVSSIFNIFSADNNGKLTINEFISMLQNWRQSFIFKEMAQPHTLLDNYKQCVRKIVLYCKDLIGEKHKFYKLSNLPVLREMIYE